MTCSSALVWDGLHGVSSLQCPYRCADADAGRGNAPIGSLLDRVPGLPRTLLPQRLPVGSAFPKDG